MIRRRAQKSRPDVFGGQSIAHTMDLLRRTIRLVGWNVADCSRPISRIVWRRQSATRRLQNRQTPPAYPMHPLNKPAQAKTSPTRESNAKQPALAPPASKGVHGRVSAGYPWPALMNCACSIRSEESRNTPRASPAMLVRNSNAQYVAT